MNCFDIGNLKSESFDFVASKDFHGFNMTFPKSIAACFFSNFQFNCVLY